MRPAALIRDGALWGVRCSLDPPRGRCWKHAGTAAHRELEGSGTRYLSRILELLFLFTSPAYSWADKDKGFLGRERRETGGQTRRSVSEQVTTPPPQRRHQHQDHSGLFISLLFPFSLYVPESQRTEERAELVHRL